MNNQPLIHAGVFWQDEAAVVPLYFETTAGAAAEGMITAGVTLQYAAESASSLSTLVPASGTFVEKGAGLYEVTVPANLMGEEGLFVLVATPTPTGYTNCRVAGTVEARRDEYRARAVPAYNATTQRLVYTAWLELNGQVVLTPTSAALTLRKEGGSGTPLIDAASMGTPNANGFFTSIHMPLTLDAKTVYEVKLAIVSGGTTHTSVSGHTTYG